MASVLVVDDDGHIREVVRFALERDGHAVTEATDGSAALESVAASAPDLVVLDVVMPGVDGLEVCRRLRSSSSVPILVLSSRDEEFDRILGLELGADAYLTKPFSPRELATTVKAMLRRVALDAAPPVDHGDLVRAGGIVLDRAAHRCTWADQAVALTVLEFAICAALAARAGEAVGRAALVEAAWGPGHAIADRTVDSHVRRIRSKLRGVGADPIETVHGVGYRLVAG